jgi:hypothetical protein
MSATINIAGDGWTVGGFAALLLKPWQRYLNSIHQPCQIKHLLHEAMLGKREIQRCPAAVWPTINPF